MDDELYHQARSAYEVGNKSEARELTRRLLSINPQNEEAWWLLAKVVESRAQAIYCLRQLIHLNPQDREARRYLSILETRSNESGIEIHQASHEKTLPTRSNEPHRRMRLDEIIKFADEQVGNRIGGLFIDLQKDAPPAVPAKSEAKYGWNWVCDSEGRYLDCSEQIWEFLDREPNEFLGQKIFSFGIVPHAELAREFFLQTGKYPLEFNVEFLAASGETIPGKLHVSAVATVNGKPTGWHGYTEVLLGSQTGLQIESNVITDPETVAGISAPTTPEIMNGLSFCPHLGLRNDQETRTSFPSPMNRCFRSEKPLPVEFAYQAKYCLSDNHVRCRIYRAGMKEPISEDTIIRTKPGLSLLQRWILTVLTLIAILALVGLAVILWLYR